MSEETLFDFSGGPRQHLEKFLRWAFRNTHKVDPDGAIAAAEEMFGKACVMPNQSISVGSLLLFARKLSDDEEGNRLW